MSTLRGPASLRDRLLLAGLAALILVAGLVTVFRGSRVDFADPEAEHQVQLEKAEHEAAEENAQRERLERARLEQQQREAAEPESLDEAAAEQETQVRRREATAEKERREREQRRAEEERLAVAALQKQKEEERRKAAELQAKQKTEERAQGEEEEPAAAEPEKEKPRIVTVPTPVEDDTPEIDSESSIDDVSVGKGFGLKGDIRPILLADQEGDRDGEANREGSLGARMRLQFTWGITEKVRIVGRLAGLCFTNDCDLDFVLDSSSGNGLDGGQFTLDELFVHWFRRERFDVAFGRLQTRFVLRGGVFPKSLDRNDSNNVNVTWTDGLQATYRAQNGWSSNLVVQLNSEEGSGSIRRGSLDFGVSDAKTTYFFAAENLQSVGPVVQRTFDVSYLPNSLLDDADGSRRDYWGLVGRVAVRWPQRSEGPRLRAGMELGYAPVTPTKEAVGLPGPGHVDGLAWDVVISAMDFAPGHNIGLNYGRTGAAWFLSPQFRPNEELIEIRYQWRPERFPLTEARIRRREDLEQLVGASRKRVTWDFYARMTWQFEIKKF
jgi:hypothetical protein